VPGHPACEAPSLGPMHPAQDMTSGPGHVTSQTALLLSHLLNEQHSVSGGYPGSCQKAGAYSDYSANHSGTLPFYPASSPSGYPVNMYWGREWGYETQAPYHGNAYPTQTPGVGH
jgi:hypothetical protein